MKSSLSVRVTAGVLAIVAAVLIGGGLLIVNVTEQRDRRDAAGELQRIAGNLTPWVAGSLGIGPRAHPAQQCRCRCSTQGSEGRATGRAAGTAAAAACRRRRRALQPLRDAFAATGDTASPVGRIAFLRAVNPQTGRAAHPRHGPEWTARNVDATRDARDDNRGRALAQRRRQRSRRIADRGRSTGTHLRASRKPAHDRHLDHRRRARDRTRRYAARDPPRAASTQGPTSQSGAHQRRRRSRHTCPAARTTDRGRHARGRTRRDARTPRQRDRRPRAKRSSRRDASQPTPDTNCAPRCRPSAPTSTSHASADASPEERQLALEVATQQSERMNRLVDGLQSLARGEAGLVKPGSRGRPRRHRRQRRLRHPHSPPRLVHRRRPARVRAHCHRRRRRALAGDREPAGERCPARTPRRAHHHAGRRRSTAAPRSSSTTTAPASLRPNVNASCAASNAALAPPPQAADSASPSSKPKLIAMAAPCP